jgi:anthranilate phosphoribosyltransferase
MAGSRALRVETPEQSKDLMMAVLNDEAGPARDIVMLNAGVALYAAGVAPDMGEGVALARQALASGKAMAKLTQFVARSKELAGS